MYLLLLFFIEEFLIAQKAASTQTPNAYIKGREIIHKLKKVDSTLKIKKAHNHERQISPK
jgi:hypothetical protein